MSDEDDFEEFVSRPHPDALPGPGETATYPGALSRVKDALAVAMGGRTVEQAMSAGLCVKCGNKAGPFDDALSEREHALSGLCQRCQDDVFRDPGDDE